MLALFRGSPAFVATADVRTAAADTTRLGCAQPELEEYQLGASDAYLLLGSDGVFEKLEDANQTLAGCVATATKQGTR